jgi:hypothetical protein
VTVLVAFLAGTLSSTAAPTPLNLVDVFAATCLDGAVTLSAGQASPINFGELPSALRGRLRGPTSAQIWRVEGPKRAYLYVLTYKPSLTANPKVCGVAGEAMPLGPAAEFLRRRVGATDLGERTRSREWVRLEDGYAAIATSSGDFSVLEIRWLSAEQQRRVWDDLHWIGELPKRPKPTDQEK